MMQALLSSNVLLEHMPKKKQKSGETYALFEKETACECVSVCQPKLIGVSSQ